MTKPEETECVFCGAQVLIAETISDVVILDVESMSFRYIMLPRWDGGRCRLVTTYASHYEVCPNGKAGE